MPNHDANLDRVFRALSDPTRRAVLARLAEGPATVSELAKAHDMALPSFTQHLGVLEASGVVRSEKKGRARIYELTPHPLETAETWIETRRQVWAQRLDRLDAYMKTLTERTDENGNA